MDISETGLARVLGSFTFRTASYTCDFDEEKRQYHSFRRNGKRISARTYVKAQRQYHADLLEKNTAIAEAVRKAEERRIAERKEEAIEWFAELRERLNIPDEKACKNCAYFRPLGLEEKDSDRGYCDGIEISGYEYEGAYVHPLHYCIKFNTVGGRNK